MPFRIIAIGIMAHTADQVRANADRLSALHSRIHETLKLRSHSSFERAEWEAACAKFHEQFDELFFPGGATGWSAFLANQSEGIELALLFLEVDQHTFRSGYHKQIVWDRLKKLYLAPEEHERLEQTALAYLHRRVRREFWHMVNFMRLRGSSSFWQRVEILALEGDESVMRKARWLLLARKNVPVRQWIGNELFRPKYQPGYVPQLDFLLPPS
jgi:hypothetical protein